MMDMIVLGIQEFSVKRNIKYKYGYNRLDIQKLSVKRSIKYKYGYGRLNIQEPPVKKIPNINMDINILHSNGCETFIIDINLVLHN